MGATRAKYTLEIELEAVRLVRSGQSIAATAKILGLADQTLHNWIRAEQQGRLGGAGSKPVSIFMVVDLPQPLEPKKPKISPRWMRKST